VKNNTKIIQLELSNLSCASCVAKIEKAFNKIKGIKTISVNFATSSAEIEYDELDCSLNEILKHFINIGYPAKILTQTHIHENQNYTANWLKYKTYLAVGLSILFLLEMLAHFFNFSFRLNPYIQLLFASVVQFFCGFIFYQGSYNSLKAKTANMDVLIALGTSAAYVYSFILLLLKDFTNLYFDTSTMVVTLVLVGKMLEMKSKLKAQSGMQALLKMQPKEANIEIDNQLKKILVEKVEIGAIFTVQAGEKIPFDGEIITGSSTVDESMLTGESIPVEKNPHDQIFAGTINGNNLLKAKVLKTAKETTLAHIIELVKKAQNTKAPIQKLVDKIAAIFVPIVLIISIITFFTWWLFIANITGAISSAVAVLIIACPCALGLATPIVIMVATALGAKHGILIKNAEAFEKAKKIQVIMFDKTGTITIGKPKVAKFIFNNDSFTHQAMYSMAKNSNHPASGAIVEYFKDKDISEIELNNFSEIPGKGLKANYQNKELLMGSLAFLKKMNSSFEMFKDKIALMDLSIVGLSYDHNCIAIAFLEDPLKEHSKDAIDSLKQLEILPIMLTGDQQKISEKIAKQVEIDIYFAEISPEEKAEKIKEYQKKSNYVAMVGDGINDAIALASSDVGFAVAHGTDVAMENADIGLMKNNLLDVIKAIHLSHMTTAKIKQNLFFAFFYNTATIPLAAFGFLNPIIAGIAMALSSVSVVFNAILLQRKKL
jgi:P-type Cu+ transporter